MRIGIDIDNIIADFASAFVIKLNRLQKCDINDIVSYDFGENIENDKHDYKKFWEKEVTSSFYENLSVIDRSREVIQLLIKKHEIILISSRGQKFSQVTKGWLEDNEIPYSDLILTSRIQEKVKRMSECNLVIEDDLKTARMVSAKGVRVLLYNYPWNTINLNVERIDDWGEILRKIEK